MSRWTHSICEACWNKKNPDRQAVRAVYTEQERQVCCFCLQAHQSGIYVRANPADLPCNGTEVVHKSES
jgi:hypothetical protein